MCRTKSRNSKLATQRELIELRQVLTQIAVGESKSKGNIFNNSYIFLKRDF